MSLQNQSFISVVNQGSTLIEELYILKVSLQLKNTSNIFPLLKTYKEKKK